MALHANHPDDLRAGERFASKLASVIRQEGRDPAPTLIDKLSVVGFSAPTIGGASITEVIGIDLPNLPTRAARIVRASNGRMGFQFLVPLTDAELLQAFKSVEKQPPAVVEANFPEPVVVRFPRWVRGFLAIGLGLSSWGLVLALLKLI